jgi:UDP-N-acetylmuramate dehydrogenase
LPAFVLILSTGISLKIKEKVPLAPFTTLKVGGPARYFVCARTEDELIEALDHSERKGLDVFILGGGSNILVADSGFDGLVIQIALKGIDPNVSEIVARAGEDWDEFVEYCVGQDLAGIECMSGIPGFIGGTPVQNVGAYGQEVSETIFSVRCYDREMKHIVDLANSDCGFSYRTSIFNTTDRDRYIVLAVTYDLQKGGEPKVAYKDLKEHFAGRSPSLGEMREAVLKIRRAKSMVIDPTDINSQSAGSFFKNPVVDRQILEEIRVKHGYETVPSFPFGDKVKIPAAWLIENSGFYKGFRQGNAGISQNHSLAIVNYGGATAAEIVELKNLIQQGVEAKFSIVLQPEPVFVGFDKQKS